MFRWLNKQGVESTEGYVVQSMDRYYYHYTEGDRVMKVFVEPGLQYEELSLESSGKWEAPYNGEVAAPQELAKIRSNVSKALSFMGVKHAFRG